MVVQRICSGEIHITTFCATASHLDRLKHTSRRQARHSDRYPIPCPRPPPIQGVLVLIPAPPIIYIHQTINLSSLESLVIDEADLILSYGHDADVRQIFSGAYLPKVYQSFLMSATITEDVEALKGLTLRSPVILTVHYQTI